MSGTSTGSGGWWDSIEVYDDSDYVPDTFSPGSSVEANHNLLAGFRENDFDTTDGAYTYGLLTLGMVFLVAGILACFFLPCIYACMGKSRQERLAERLNLGPKTHMRGNFLMLVASVAAIITSAGAVWGLDKADSGLTTIEARTQTIANDLKSVLDLPSDTSTALEDISTAYDDVETGIDSCTSTAVSSVVDTAFDVGDFSVVLLAALDDLDSESLSDLADDIQAVSDAVDQTEGVRKGLVWPTISLSIAILVAFIAIGLGTYGLVACDIARCGALSCVMTPCTVLLAVVIWLSAASAVTLSALSGDFCTDPDTNVQTLIDDNTDSGTLQELLTFYTTDCTTDNTAIDAIIAAQAVAVAVIPETLTTLYEAVDLCEELSTSVQTLDTTLQDLWLILEEAGQITACGNLNWLYQSAVYDNLCYHLPKGLLGFWVSCVILTVLLLVLAVQWNRMLKHQITENDADAVEASARRRGMWLSQRWSRRSVGSEPDAATGPSASSHSSKSSVSGHRSASSSKHVAVTGSGRYNSRAPAAAPSWGGGAVTTTRQPSARSAIQRPVEVANPHRAMRP